VKSRNPFVLIVVVLLVAVVVCASVYFAKNDTGQAYDARACVASANQQCPSQDYLNDYSEWQSLQDRIAKDGQSPAIHKLQNEIDLQRGLSARLFNQAPYGETPSGFSFDQSTRKFVKAPPTTSASQPQTNTPNK